MHVISKKTLRDYYLNNPQAKLPLTDWYNKMSASRAKDAHALRQEFNSADPVNGYTLFNIGGNSYRLVTAIHYNKQICYIRRVWTHAEYSQRSNAKKIQQGDL